MNFLKSLFSPGDQPQPVKPPATNNIELVPNEKYRLTRQMYLFPAQAVSAKTNDYLKIGAVVSFLKAGETVEDNNIFSPWVYVRSAKGKEGWCFSHYLEKVEGESPAAV
jgi:SH3-like domain-containing protein